MATKYIIDEYIECVESYVDSFGYEIDKDETIEECAWTLLDWCFYNNHDLDSISLPEFERIIKMFYHPRNEA